ncbi:MAG: DUF4215 domain-containing protein, partial [Polyangia bacterium]|nr:DUF4215 domain-containing protein [Polyangia bacterium]
GATCESLGHGPGTLACTATCGFDTSGCSPSTCGNLIIDLGEECDGLNLSGSSCVGLGFDSGILACTDLCQFDTSECLQIGCGNGIIESGEECDDGNQTGADGCNSACHLESGWVCVGQPSVCTQSCGNGAIDTGEECDGALLGGATCASLGLTSGNLVCSQVCRYDVSGCEGTPCGNGTIDTGEECDGTNFGTATCASLGFTGGVLQCTAGCTRDTSQCTSNVCGNGTVETGEDCDGVALNGASCVSLGYSSGTLVCASNCTFNTTGCIAATSCGNGVLDSGEACDDGNTVGGDGCSGSCQYETTCSTSNSIACGATVTYDMMLFESDKVQGYSCGSELGDTADRIYSFVAPATGVATLFLDVEADGFLGDELDLYVLGGSCHPGLCVGASETAGDDSLAINVTAGKTYYAVVEFFSMGFPGAGGAFSLTLTCP